MTDTKGGAGKEFQIARIRLSVILYIVVQMLLDYESAAPSAWLGVHDLGPGDVTDVVAAHANTPR